MTKLFALVDCNNFYVSCERVFNPKLRNKPVAVLSNNDGCIVARSNEVKKLGIKMGTPYFKCKHILDRHNVAVFSSNYSLYGDMSHRVMATLSHAGLDMEIYSIDEAFISLRGFSPDAAVALGRTLRKTVLQWTGIPVSIGIGPTKTLTKIAIEHAKKNLAYEGVVKVMAKESDEPLLAHVPVSDVWGVGYAYTKVLERQGIRNALQLRDAPPRWVQKKMHIPGLRTVQELQGISCIPLEEAPPARKSIVKSRSFGTPIITRAHLGEAVATYMTRAAEKLRQERLTATCVHVFIMTSRFIKEEYYAKSKVIELPRSTSYTPTLLDWTDTILDQIYKPGYQYKRAGIMLTGLVPQDQKQSAMFSVYKQEGVRSSVLMHSIDRLNKRWGSDTITYVATGIKRPWTMRRSKKSPQFTTQWDELLRVKVS